MFNKKTLFALGGLIAMTAVAIFVFLQLTHKKTMVEKGWDIVGALKSGDAHQLAKMISPEELSLTGMSQGTAEKLIKQIVLPKCQPLIQNLKQISKAGNEIVFEKEVNDPYFKFPPALVLPPSNGDHIISLTELVMAVWAVEGVDYSKRGLSRAEYLKYLAGEFAQARSLGLTKVVNWYDRSVMDMPTKPFGS